MVSQLDFLLNKLPLVLLLATLLLAALSLLLLSYALFVAFFGQMVSAWLIELHLKRSYFTNLFCFV